MPLATPALGFTTVTDTSDMIIAGGLPAGRAMSNGGRHER